jgi:hypothetical protein
VLKRFGGHGQAFPVGQTGDSQPIPKAGIGGSPRFAAYGGPPLFKVDFSATESHNAPSK